ncbi:hypothetical protein TNCV_904441 [Trichonephila clavipes]|nr:hypothetical protein TNCV_904331 [Trichonephila clavipes]GFV74005.1 hypothetical protein TNCV_904371 [Trichonephila clavipes]GFV74008.1 hypothetical protein TNCV_904401 [Trichonephila clavipes]GFV74013.1 hypothetical protein TNCV_904441 [Trichonephila clavipes]
MPKRSRSRRVYTPNFGGRYHSPTESYGQGKARLQEEIKRVSGLEPRNRTGNSGRNWNHQPGTREPVQVRNSALEQDGRCARAGKHKAELHGSSVTDHS